MKTYIKAVTVPSKGAELIDDTSTDNAHTWSAEKLDNIFNIEYDKEYEVGFFGDKNTKLYRKTFHLNADKTEYSGEHGYQLDLNASYVIKVEGMLWGESWQTPIINGVNWGQQWSSCCMFYCINNKHIELNIGQYARAWNGGYVTVYYIK